MFDRITFESAVMGGRACIRGMRITVALVVNLVANGMSADDIVREYPDLEAEDIRQSLQHASALANEEIGFFKSPAARNSWPTWACRSRPVEALRTANHNAVHLRDEVLIHLPIQRSPRRLWPRVELCSRLIWISETFSRPPKARVRASSSLTAKSDARCRESASLRVIANCVEELARGAIVIVEDEGFRLRRLPIRP